MRWEMLFADLEAAVEAGHRADLDVQVAQGVRAERAALRLADRLRAHEGQITCWLLGGDLLTGRLADVGADWLLIEDRGPVLVAMSAVAGVQGLGRRADGDREGLAGRVGITVLLRGLARERAPVTLLLVDSGRLTGTIDRVGADHLDLAMHPADRPRRWSEVLGVRIVPLSALAWVRPG
jgi:hypothetical protein